MKSQYAICPVLVLFLWTVSIPTSLSDCIFPRKAPLNGFNVYQAPQDGRTKTAPENYLLRFGCYSGYTLKGAEATLCSSNKWTHRTPRCIRILCNDPPTIENGHYERSKDGSTARYSCDAGYQLENATDSVLTCLINDTYEGEWNGKLPNCRKYCPDPGVSPDGTREGNCCFMGDVLLYSCNNEFELEGKGEIQCLATGNWSTPRPFCRPLDDFCDHPPSISHGYIQGEKEGDFYRPYDEVEVRCDPGFRYKGYSSFILCEEENRWEEEFDECIEVFCDTPYPLANGTILEIETANITSFPYNFDLTYICDEGFRLVGGQSWRSCDIKGWSGKTPHCEVINCPDPGAPEYGSRVGSSYDIGKRVIFNCFTGYQLIGSYERYCLPNGQWSGDLARCDLSDNYCPDPGIPINGVKDSSNYDLGDKINFQCQAGYILLGSETRECLPNGTWSGEEVRCLGRNDFHNTAEVGEILKIAVIEKREEQRRELEKYYTSLRPMMRPWEEYFPRRLIFYFIFDNSGSAREHNFRKTVEFAKAIVKKIGISENGARVGAIALQSNTFTRFSPLDYSSTQEVMEAFDRLNYNVSGGGTSMFSALSTIREEYIPLTQDYLPMSRMKSVIYLLTNGKMYLRENLIYEAELLKAARTEIYCFGITNAFSLQSLYKIASVPKKKHFFILPNYHSFVSLIREISKGVVDYSECGLGVEEVEKVSQGRIIGSSKTSKSWPWMAALYEITHGERREMICSGSIINERFILTAAHCLYRKDGYLRESKDLVVKLGETDATDKIKMEELRVENFSIYPQSSFEKSLFHHDIALLKLKQPIEFNAIVRPICLPPVELTTNTPLYKPRERAVSVGWIHNKIMEKQQRVDVKPRKDFKETIIPIQPPKWCKDSLIDYYKNPNSSSETMFCAGGNEGGTDTCQEDSGGPLMQSQWNKKGYIYWTQIGVVSWGPGCGLPNAFGYYTHVQKMLPWINETIQSED